jgi:hypothetical protein
VLFHTVYALIISEVFNMTLRSSVSPKFRASRTLLGVSMVLAGTLRLISGALAQAYPQKSIKLVVNHYPAVVETLWREHLLHMRDLVMSVYKTPMTIEVLNGPVGKLRPVDKFKRADL